MNERQFESANRMLNRCGSYALGLLAQIVGTPVLAQQACITEAASIGDQGQMPGYASLGGVSSGGRFVVFDGASAFTANDQNLQVDVFVRDRELGSTSLVSVATDGTQGDNRSRGVLITPSGRFVLFYSDATNLVPNDANNKTDYFIHDRVMGTTSRVVLNHDGSEITGPFVVHCWSLGADGRYVIFDTANAGIVPNDNNTLQDVFLRDVWLGTTMQLSVTPQGQAANDHSGGAIITGDARFVVFFTGATNLASPSIPDSPGTSDILRLDRLTGVFDPVTLDVSGDLGNGYPQTAAVSADGRFVAFEADGPGYVPNDTNNRPDIFVRDMLLGLTTRVSVKSNGGQANDGSRSPKISANGRFIAFESDASDLFSNDQNTWDIFVHDRWTQATTIQSLSTSGTQANLQCLGPVLSPDGTCAAFVSIANNLLDTGDPNGFASDVFVRECTHFEPLSYCAAKTNSLDCIPNITSSGFASSTPGAPFQIRGLGILNHRPGLLIYSVAGQTLIPFQGGYLCLVPPLVRTGVQISGGTPPPTWDCSGVLQLDFNAWIQSGVDPALVAGQEVYTQYWYRDAGFPPPDATGLTDALLFTIQ